MAILDDVTSTYQFHNLQYVILAVHKGRVFIKGGLIRHSKISWLAHCVTLEI